MESQFPRCRNKLRVANCFVSSFKILHASFSMYSPTPDEFLKLAAQGNVIPVTHRRKPLVEKLERFVKFKPQTPLREIIRLTAN
jgi:hypothetical protein